MRDKLRENTMDTISNHGSGDEVDDRHSNLGRRNYRGNYARRDNNSNNERNQRWKENFPPRDDWYSNGRKSGRTNSSRRRGNDNRQNYHRVPHDYEDGDYEQEVPDEQTMKKVMSLLKLVRKL